MGKCGQKTEIYNRVCGYFRPINQWNKGKREEFNERKPYKIGKKEGI
jgi:ribonucleoside-triphosphate reductase